MLDARFAVPGRCGPPSRRSRAWKTSIDWQLPKGWRADGPHAATTKPRGLEGDPNFTAGGDVVHCDIALPQDAPEDGLRVVVWLLYQPVPPGWVDALRGIDAPEARAFVDLYDAADPAPEKLAVAARTEGR